MVKDSKKYAAAGGWGFADIKDGKPSDEALHKTCFPCHVPAKDRDYVFACYALMHFNALRLLEIIQKRGSRKLAGSVTISRLLERETIAEQPDVTRARVRRS